MDESQDQNSANQEVATLEQPNHESIEQQSQQSQVEDTQDRNWRAMRERQRELEITLKQQMEMNEKLLALASKAQPVVEVPDELDQLADDEFLPKGKVKKLVQKEKEAIKREAVEEVKQLLQKQEQAKFMDHLRAKFSDFDEIVNKETLAILDKQEPELAQAISQGGDPFKTGVQCYKYIKALGLAAKVPEVRKAKEVEKKLEKNAQTVQSPLAYDKRPMAQAYKETEAERTALYNEMMGYARQAGMSY